MTVEHHRGWQAATTVTTGFLGMHLLKPVLPSLDETSKIRWCIPPTTAVLDRLEPKARSQAIAVAIVLGNYHNSLTWSVRLYWIIYIYTHIGTTPRILIIIPGLSVFGSCHWKIIQWIHQAAKQSEDIKQVLGDTGLYVVYMNVYWVYWVYWV